MEKHQDFENKIKEIIKEKGLSWEESIETKETLYKIASTITPLAIFLLLFLIPVLSILEISNPYEFLAGLAVSIFLLFLLCGSFYILVLKKRTLSPWIIGWAEKAIDVQKKEKIKIKTNLILSLFFLFMGVMFFIADPGDPVGRGVALAFGVGFNLIAIFGIINHLVWKAPQKIFFFLKHNRVINIFLFALIFLFCFSIVFSFLLDFL